MRRRALLAALAAALPTTAGCLGSGTGGVSTGTATSTVVHAGWFTQAFVYWVDEDSLVRERKQSG